MHFWGIQRLEGAISFGTLGWETICDFQFKRTENHYKQYKPACGILSLLDISIISLFESKYTIMNTYPIGIGLLYH